MGLRVRGPSFDSCLGLIWERGVDQAPNPPVEASPHRGELPRSAKIAFGKVRAGFALPTGPVKPARSGSGLPDRFNRKPVETG